MKKLQEFFRNDRFAASVGIELLEIGKGRARAKLDICRDHFNAVNIVHGAAIFQGMVYRKRDKLMPTQPPPRPG